jgi:hypothetical protein
MILATAFSSFRYRVPRDGRLFRAGLTSSAIAAHTDGASDAFAPTSCSRARLRKQASSLDLQRNQRG